MHIFDPYELTGLKPNHLGFGGLDRGAELHEDKDCIQKLLKSEETLIIPVWRTFNLFSKIEEKKEKPLPASLAPLHLTGDPMTLHADRSISEMPPRK